ncbi:DUF4136 domain-containing protein [Novipirellula artificiosorum]|uniref:DUF4136 domain-containing protein n=1 Tax=Novipirellula artificiosorum TaxID=2528016 RepID=A0A5C6D248_9BACT|nr:DUF4136 domain-containing protein [Novipirellula artificiosorum]TWU30808.1 hypothetical protein Poly41_65020 [Novipirellula artificiosorum]
METFIIIGVVLVIVVLCSTSSTISGALIPQSVRDAVSKLMPGSPIVDATANMEGETVVFVGSKANSKTVYVRRGGEMTTACTYSSASRFPRSGTFAFIGFEHNLKPGMEAMAEQAETRIRKCLTEALALKQFQLAEQEVADILITVFCALDDHVELFTLGEAFDEPDGHKWGTALRTALRHDQVDEMATFARGSLLIEVVDATTDDVWQAVAMADIVVEVSEKERARRTHRAIFQMLDKFPPKSAKQSPQCEG